MLVISRKVGDEITIGEDITVVIGRIAGRRVTIGIRAPREVRIIRSELEPFPTAADGASKDRRTTAPAEGEMVRELDCVHVNSAAAGIHVGPPVFDSPRPR